MMSTNPPLLESKTAVEALSERPSNCFDLTRITSDDASFNPTAAAATAKRNLRSSKMEEEDQQ